MIRPVIRDIGKSIGNAIGVPFGGASQSWESYWASKDWANYLVLIKKIYASKDTLIASNNPTYNYGVGINLAVGEYNSAVVVTRSLLDFDLSSIEDEWDLQKAILVLWHASNLADNTRKLQVFRTKRNWVEGSGNGSATGDGATWNKYDASNNWQTAGGFGADDCEQTAIGELEIAHNQAINVRLSVPLTATKKSELTLGYGLLLKNETETNDGHLYKSINNIDKLKPYLSLEIATAINGTESSLLTKYTSNPLFTSAFGSIVYEGVNQYSFYYCKPTQRYIYKRSSTDGITWGSESTVLDTGVGIYTEVSSAWKEGSTWYMLYRSNEWGGNKSIGLATSADGTTWVREATNPVIINTDIGAWCTGDIDPWGIIKVGSTYYLWVNDVNEVPRQTGLMTSTDLINWTPDANNPIFDNGRYCGTVIKYGGDYYMFICYTPEGAIGAYPIKNRIELYRDSDPRFLPASREYLGVVLLGGESGEWDDDYLDTPSIITETIQRDTFPLGDAENGKLWMYYSAKHGTTWTQGLATGHLEMLDKLTALTEPAAGE